MVALTQQDYEALASQLGTSVKTIQAGVDSKRALHTFNMVQLKTIIKYLRDKGARANLTGNKGTLVDNIARVLWEENGTQTKPPSNQTIASLLPVGHGGHTGHTTTEHNAPWQPWNSLPKPSGGFNDEYFLAKQVPYFEHSSVLTVIPFLAREDMHPRASFNIDEATYTSVKEKKRCIHARFFSKERKGDIPWNIDVVLKINGSIIDIQKLARKIRSKAYKEPYILPRPADISQVVRQNGNSVEFCHPGETGFLVLQVVKQIELESLISHVATNKVVSASRANMKNDDIEEMNYVLSMKCPLSYVRIETPVKSKNCNHEQCFDLAGYLEYSYQQQIWHCPVCEIGAPYKDLIYDQRFKNILQSYPAADKVIVNPDGTIVDADIEPTAKRQKTNTPPSTASTPTPAPSIVSPPPPNVSQPPPNVIALDSPPPSPPAPIPKPPATTTSTTTTTTTTSSSTLTPFVFAPPTSTPATTIAPPVPVPPSLTVTPSSPAMTSQQLPTSPTPSISTLQSSPPTPVSSSPQTPQTPPPPQNSTPPPPNGQQSGVLSSSPPPLAPSPSTSTPTTTSHPHQVHDLKQEPGLIKKILQKFSPNVSATPTPPFSSGAPATPTVPPISLASPPSTGGFTSNDAIVISDDDD